MKKQSGFTLIELLVVMTILAILIAMVIGGIFVSMSSGEQDSSFGINVVKTRCIGGYQHTVGAGGRQAQIIGENGGGVPCTK